MRNSKTKIFISETKKGGVQGDETNTYIYVRAAG